MFDKEKFLDYMEKKYPESGSIILFELLGNLVDYAGEYHNHSKDQMVDFLSDIIPEAEFGEIAQFMPDEHLTKVSQIEKWDWIEANSDDLCAENMNEANRNVLAAVNSALCLYDPVELRVSVGDYDMIQIEIIEQGEYMNRVEYAPDCDLEQLRDDLETIGVNWDF